MSDDPSSNDPIQNAIKEYEVFIEDERRRAQRVGIIAIGSMVFIAACILFVLLRMEFVQTKMGELGLTNYIFGGIFVSFAFVFGVLMSIYRFHLNEAAKAEHYRIGFIRIRIAAESDREGYQTEVRGALTQDAFRPPIMTRRKGQIESPLPGHPSSDLATVFLNKLIDTVEIKPKKPQRPKD